MKKRNYRVNYFLSFLLVFSFLELFSQQVKVSGGFLSDSVRIGDQTAYYLTARSDSKLMLLFPDSTFNFNPFEFEKKQYFPTHTTNGQSYDSVVYYLSTFEIDSIQYLSLPAFVVNPKDCTEFKADRDGILLAQVVGHIPDSISVDKLPLKVNTAYHKVLWLFNYPLLLIIVGAVLLLVILGWIIFGKKIRRHFRIRKLEKIHTKFVEEYSASVAQVKTSFSSAITESAISLWKKYMEQLEARPFTKLTTREMLVYENDDALGKSLHTVDKTIYGHHTAVLSSLEELGDYANQRFSKKLEEVKHG